MRRLTFLLLALSAAALAAGDAKLNGRWDITGEGKPRIRAWWLEIIGADTPTPHGSFVTAFGGDRNEFKTMKSNGGNFRIDIFRQERRSNGKTRQLHAYLKGQLVGDKIEGTYTTKGLKSGPIKWVGVRAPVIADKDDGSWKEAAPIQLFNGKDLTGWKQAEAERTFNWTIADGEMRSTGKTSNIMSEQKFWNFILHLEFKMHEHSNSGVGIRGRYEIQIADDYGREPGTHTNGALYSRVAAAVNASNKAGEWQTYDIRVVGRQLTVVLNGKKIHDKTEIEGLTAIANDPNEAEPGPVYLQGDHGPVEFRNIVLTPLVK
jgi:hypothetical protein